MLSLKNDGCLITKSLVHQLLSDVDKVLIFKLIFVRSEPGPGKTLPLEKHKFGPNLFSGQSLFKIKNEYVNI